MNSLPTFDFGLTSNPGDDGDDDEDDLLLTALNAPLRLPTSTTHNMGVAPGLTSQAASELFDSLMGQTPGFEPSFTPGLTVPSPPPPSSRSAMMADHGGLMSSTRTSSRASSTVYEAGVKREELDDDGCDADRKGRRKRNRRRKLVAQLNDDEKERTRLVNRVAAQRHRVIAKAKKREKQERFERMTRENNTLQRCMQELTGELSTLRCLVVDMYGPGGARALAFLQSGSNASYLGL
jgi:hypothetical protein